MLLLSSNNACLTGDLFGRILKCRIDAKVDNPERRSFDFEPVKYCIEHRHDIVAAALTILRGYISAGMPRDPYAGTGIGSFEAWELIRQTVLWLQREGIPPLSASLGDPIKCVEITKAMDPDQQSLRAFLESVYECKRSNEWQVGSLVANAEPGTDLHDALIEIAGDRSRNSINGVNTRTLGRQLTVLMRLNRASEVCCC